MGRYAKLEQLEIKRLGAGTDGGGAGGPTGEERAELARLRTDPGRYRRQRITVSQEFISQVDLEIVTKLESGLDRLPRRPPRRRT